MRSRGLLLVLLSIAGLAAWNPPLAAQSGPVQKVLEEVTGSGASQDKPSEGEDQGGKQGVLPEKPPESILARKDLLEPDAWARLAEEMVGSFVRWLPSLLTAILILCVFFILYRLAAGLLGRLMNRTRADPAARDIAVRLTRYAILAIGLMMAASQLGIQVGSLLAGVGIIGLALGLAAQDSLANLVAGITILWDRPFRIGDNVTVSGTFGKVKEIGLRTTRIRTVEHLDAILPNKEIINAKIVNHTLSPMMRLGIPVGIAYKEDTREARRVLLEAVAGHDLVLEQPEPQVVVTELADSAVNLELRVWLRDPYEERAATFTMVELAKIALDEAGIEIPFPQRTLHLPGPLPELPPRAQRLLDSGETSEHERGTETDADREPEERPDR